MTFDPHHFYQMAHPIQQQCEEGWELCDSM